MLVLNKQIDDVRFHAAVTVTSEKGAAVVTNTV